MDFSGRGTGRGSIGGSDSGCVDADVRVFVYAVVFITFGLGERMVAGIRMGTVTWVGKGREMGVRMGVVFSTEVVFGNELV